MLELLEQNIHTDNEILGLKKENLTTYYYFSMCVSEFFNFKLVTLQVN